MKLVGGGWTLEDGGRLEAHCRLGGRRLEAGSCRLEGAGWRVLAGGCSLEAGVWELETAG